MSTGIFEDYLDEHGTLVYKNVGTSMLPLIRQGVDLVVIRKYNGGPLKRKDVILYRRNDKYVLHRIIGKDERGYILCGDHHWQKEYGVTDEMIIGQLASVIRGKKGRELSFDSFGYRLYTFLWCDLFPIRSFILKIKYRAYILKKKIFGKK